MEPWKLFKIENTKLKIDLFEERGSFLLPEVREVFPFSPPHKVWRIFSEDD
jgi:hypothetical protein